MNDLSKQVMFTARMEALVDDGLMQVFADSVAHFKTTDLVFFYDENPAVNAGSMLPREVMLEGDEVPAALRAALSKPASEVTAHDADTDTAFWFVMVFVEGKIGCLPINAQLTGPGGPASTGSGSH